MTTHKPYHAPKVTVTFGKPTVGPKIYLARGPSGWPEQFPRRDADKALDNFLTPIDVEEMLKTFDTAMKLESREELWGDVIGYLAKITTTPENRIPEVVGVAFWGRYVLWKRREETN